MTTIKPALIAQIERAKDVNAAMFDAIDRARAAASLDQAMHYLHSHFARDHALYWFYRGGRHIAVHSRHHARRIAIIKEDS